MSFIKLIQCLVSEEGPCYLCNADTRPRDVIICLLTATACKSAVLSPCTCDTWNEMRTQRKYPQDVQVRLSTQFRIRGFVLKLVRRNTVFSRIRVKVGPLCKIRLCSKPVTLIWCNAHFMKVQGNSTRRRFARWSSWAAFWQQTRNLFKTFTY